METSNFFRNFVQQFSENLPKPLLAWRLEFEQHMLTGLNLAFSKLSLVTKQDLEIQSQILARLQDKVEQLQQKLNTLEENKNSSTREQILAQQTAHSDQNIKNLCNKHSNKQKEQV